MFFIDHMLRHDRLTCERTLVTLQVGGLDQSRVGRNLIARLNNNDIAHNHVMTGNLCHIAVASHLHRLLLAEGCEGVKLTRGVHLKHEAHGCGYEDGEEYAQGLDKLAVYERQSQRHECRHDKNLYYRVVIFFNVEFPQRCSLRRREHIFSMLCAALLHLSRREPRHRLPGHGFPLHRLFVFCCHLYKKCCLDNKRCLFKFIALLFL